MLFGTIDPISTASENILGIKIYHQEFFKALVKHSNFLEYHIFAGDRFSIKRCEEFIEKEILSLCKEPKKTVKVLHRSDIPRYLTGRRYTVFHKHDPKIEPLCYMRDTYSKNLFPITGITHSLSYQRFMYDFFHTMLSNTSPFDSILCTTRSAQTVIEKGFAAISLGFKQRFDKGLSFNGRFDILPIGIDTDRFAPTDSALRDLLREKAGFSKDAVILLTVSRFSLYSKMDLFPLIKKLSPLFQKDKDLFYILAGSNHESDYADKLADYINSIGLSGRIIIMKDISDEKKLELYKTADIFLSPSDNPQESFGINIIEAASSGLPVIASNWDGYKDIIEDGKTGLLIDTVWGDCGDWLNNIIPLSFEREYHLYLGQSVSVDLNKFTAATLRLLTDKPLRLAMGIAARKTVQERFSWEVVIKRYEEIVSGLKHIMDKCDTKDLKKKEHLFTMKYFDIFSHYPSHILSDTDLLTLSAAGTGIINRSDKISIYEEIEKIFNIDLPLLILQNISKGENLSVSDIKERLRLKYAEEKIVYSILWMLKHDIIKLKQE